MTPAGRQGTVDTPRLCFYATDPASRPECALTAVVRYDTLALCPTCQPRRSTIGKGTAVVTLPAAPALDVLDWVGTSAEQAAAAQHTLTAAVTRARQADHSWATIGARLGISKQAAQQRFGRPNAGKTHSSKPKTNDTRRSPSQPR